LNLTNNGFFSCYYQSMPKFESGGWNPTKKYWEKKKEIKIKTPRYFHPEFKVYIVNLADEIGIRAAFKIIGVTLSILSLEKDLGQL
jgi:hypothetical protein